MTDELANEFAMSTGVYYGDGRQTSHWKDDDLTGALVGIMDPTLGYGETSLITYADLRALDLIGYEFIILGYAIGLVLFGLSLLVLGPSALPWRRHIT